MKIACLNAKELTAGHIEAWSQLQRADPALASPFFRPEFVLALASVLDNVEVAVLSDRDDMVGFWPFQRGPRNVGRPAGSIVNDYHGPILRRDIAVDPEALLRGCSLAAWCFDHLPATLPGFAPYHRRIVGSPYLDLSQGFEAYRRNLPSRSDEASQTLRKLRNRVVRDLGPVRFEFHRHDPELLTTLFQWKQQQYDRTNVPNIFERTWVEPLLRRIAATETPDFRGVVTSLYGGDRLLAVHFGMVSGKVLHYWFPAYDVELQTYSPGSALLVKLAEACPDRGIETIDLGKGSEVYKRRFMSAAHLLAEGFIDSRPLQRAVRETWWTTRNWVHRSRWREPVRRAWDRLRPIRQWLPAN